MRNLRVSAKQQAALNESFQINLAFGLSFHDVSSVRLNPILSSLMESRLLTQVVQSLPKQFVTETLKSVEWAYVEAHNTTLQDPLMEGPERDYVYPHYRRAILERRLRNVASEQGLESRSQWNFARNHQFTEIVADKLVLTCSHKNGEDWRMLPPSIFRERNAKLNSLLAQLQFNGGGFENDSPVADVGQLNAVIYHGTDLRDKGKVGYLRLGFPSGDNRRWAARFDFYEILNAYPHATPQEEAEDEDIIIQWKSKARELEG